VLRDLCGTAGTLVPGNITGVIGCDPGSTSNPASVIRSRNSVVLRRSTSRCSPEPSTIANACIEPAATAGATELENR